MKKIGSFAPALIAALLFVFCISVAYVRADEKAPVPQVPVEGKVTMVDIGAKKCIPCKMMIPILKELEEEYTATGKAAIVFIDVWENPAVGHKFGIKSIPTQIFYNAEGKEISRHEGFMDKNSIISRLEKMGVR